VTRSKFLQRTQISEVTCDPQFYLAISAQCGQIIYMSGMIMIKMFGAIKKKYVPG
jgi:hypothetical protein